MLQRIKNYFDVILASTLKAPRIKSQPQKAKIEAIEVIAENDKLQMLEWLKLLKK